MKYFKKYWLSHKLANSKILISLYNHVAPSFREIVRTFQHKVLSKNPLFTTFSQLLVVSEVGYNKKEYSLWQKLKKHPLFATFLLVFNVFEVCIFSNMYWPLLSQLKNDIFTHDNLYPFFISPLQMPFEIYTFYHIFTIFNSEMCNISNKCRHPNKLVKHYYLYTIYLIVIVNF